MRLTSRIYLVGSGLYGFGLTNDYDCHVYLVDCGSSAVLVDSGVGLEVDRARDVEDPEKKISIWKRSQLKRIADASSTEERQEARQRTDLRIRAIGSGSDYTVFLDHLGVATLDLGFGDEDGGGGLRAGFASAFCEVTSVMSLEGGGLEPAVD